MQTIITLNTIGLIILFVICSLFLILLLNAYKHIAKLEDEKAEAIKRADYHVKQLKKKAGYDDQHGFDFGEKGATK